MKQLYFFIALALIFALNTGIAQDPHFSQFFANRVYLNPAYSGFDPGWSANLNYRNQWFGIPDGDIGTFRDNFETYQVTIELQTPCFLQVQNFNFGTSLSFFQDHAGDAPLTTTGIGWAFSHEVSSIVDRGGSGLNRLDLRVGFQTSFMQKRLRGDYFIYSAQLDHVEGLVQDPEVLRFSSSWFSNINTGLMLRGAFDNKFNPILFTVGAALSNVNQPDQSLDGSAGGAILPRRLTIHAGLALQLNKKRGVTAPTTIAPQFRWDTQLGSKLNLHTIGAYAFSKAYYSGLFFQYNFPSPDNTNTTNQGEAFLIRNTSTLILNAGIDLKSLFDGGKPWRKRNTGCLLGFTYDINLTGLNSSNTLGTIELNLRWNFRRSKKSNAFCGQIGKFELYDGECPITF